MIDKETDKNGETLETVTQELTEKLKIVQEKLNKLTRAYLDEVIDQESYEAATADLVLEKTTLKREKERLAKTGSSSWNEPAKDFIKALEMAGKLQTAGTPEEISELVLKVGTNRLMWSKKVSFSFSPNYDFAASLLGNMNQAVSDNPSLNSDSNWWSTKWCAREDLNLLFTISRVAGQGYFVAIHCP